VIIEGSAMLPELMVQVQGAASCVIVARPGLLTSRIVAQAGEANAAAKKFAARAELLNSFISREARTLGITNLDAESASVEDVIAMLERA
jgi:hypothetical protein